MIDTFLAKVQSVSDAAYDAQGHLCKEASITLLVYDGTSNKELTLTNGEDNYSYVKGDYVLLNAYTCLPTIPRSAALSLTLAPRALITMARSSLRPSPSPTLRA